MPETPLDTVKAIRSNAAASGCTVDIQEHTITDANGNPVTDKDGNPIKQYATILTYMPDSEKQALSFFTESFVPHTKELQNLHTRYKMELRRGSRCSSCDRGKLMKKYLPQVRDAFRRQEFNTGAGSVPGSITRSAEGVKTSQPVLRRQNANLASIYKIGPTTRGGKA